ncbi:MAG: universal stress protein [Planctomycetota bacterium]|jgi:nucleotide-binding universal stress UspA family protein
MIKLKKILLPTDFSERAAHAMSYAGDLAKTFGAQIDLVHVHQSPIYTGAFGYGTIELPANYEDETRKAVLARLDDQRKKLRQDISVKTTFLEGVPFQELINYAAENDVDLIVMSTRGYTGLKHVLLGSTAERVVRVAPCPVLTIRPVGD